MLLRRLVDYNSRRTDPPPAYYRHKQIAWKVTLHDQGASVDCIRPPRAARGEVQDRGVLRPAPHVHRTSAVTPLLLADTAQYVLGVPHRDPKTGEVSSKDAAKAAKYKAAFLALTEQWAATVPDDGTAKAVLDFLRTPRPTPDGLEAGDLVAFTVDGRWVHEQESVTRFWAEHVRRLKTGRGQNGTCLVCGDQGLLLDSFPEAIRKGAIPPGGDVNGSAIVSINTPAQGRSDVSAGLAGTPVCEQCGTSAVNALNALLVDLQNRHRGADFVTIWWTREPADTSWMRQLDDPEPQQVAELMNAARTARERVVAGVDPNDFHALTLGLNAGRAVVKDWIDVPLHEIKIRLGRWFDDHRIHDGWRDEDRVFSVWRLSLAASRWDRRGDKYVPATIPVGLEAALYSTALHGTPPPAWILPRLLQRIRADQHADTARTALLRLALTRTHAHALEDLAMPGLNPENTNPGYVCGRLFATLESIQYIAGKIGDRKVNATIRDKYFGTVMTSPGSVLPNLRVGANNHLGQIRRRRPATASALERKLGAIFSLLGDDIPAVLPIPHQGAFVLGYEHQRADDFARASAAKAAREAGNAAEGDAELVLDPPPDDTPGS